MKVKTFSKNRITNFAVPIAISVALLTSSVGYASPVPDFMANAPSPTQSSATAMPAPPVPPSPGPGPSVSHGPDLSGIPDINTPGADLAPKTTGLEDPSGGTGDVSEFSGPTEKDKAFLQDLIKLRERVILDVLKQRASNLEKNLSTFEAVPPGMSQKPKIVIQDRPKSKKPESSPIKVLGIHEDRVFVQFEGHSSWIPVGGQIGPYRLKSVTDKSAVFAQKTGKDLVVQKASRVIPRPGIVVESVDNQTATIKYNGGTYTVTLSSPVGSDLTVTALNQTDFSVTDQHGRVFTYPVPQKSVAPTPSQYNPGFPQSPMPPQYGQQGNNQQGGSSAEDNSY